MWHILLKLVRIKLLNNILRNNMEELKNFIETSN